MEKKQLNPKIRYSFIAFFFAYIIFHFVITMKSGTEWYPFSPYRMFSKNWKNEIVMERIRYKNSETDRFLFPWEVMKIPFFQANQFSFNIYLDLNDLKAKEKLCAIFPVSGLVVFREAVKYTLAEQKMIETIQVQEPVYVCNK